MLGSTCVRLANRERAGRSEALPGVDRIAQLADPRAELHHDLDQLLKHAERTERTRGGVGEAELAAELAAGCERDLGVQLALRDRKVRPALRDRRELGVGDVDVPFRLAPVEASGRGRPNRTIVWPDPYRRELRRRGFR